MKNFIDDIKSEDTKYANMHIEDGILFCYYKKIDTVDLEVAKIGAQDRVRFSDNNSYPCLFDIRLMGKVTKEARDYLANEGNDLVTASALVVGSSVIKIIANFFITVNKPKNPTRMFTDKESAIIWLHKFN